MHIDVGITKSERDSAVLEGLGAGRRDSTVCERLMSVQLYRYTHENINALSVRKVFSAVLVIYFTVWGLIIGFLTE